MKKYAEQTPNEFCGSEGIGMGMRQVESIDSSTYRVDLKLTDKYATKFGMGAAADSMKQS
jgi:hypothetical protein